WAAKDAFLLVGTETGVEMWDAQKGTRIKSIDVGPTGSLAYSPRPETRLAAGHLALKNPVGRVSFIDTANGKETPIYPEKEETQREFNVSAFSPDGKLFASAAVTSQTIYLWDRTTLKVRHRLAGQGRPYFAAGWGKDGKTIVWSGGAYRSLT